MVLKLEDLVVLLQPRVLGKSSDLLLMTNIGLITLFLPMFYKYVPESPINFISPQRWAQESDTKEGSNKGTFFCNFGDESFFWNKIQYMKTIFNDPANNFPVLQYKGTNEDVVRCFIDNYTLCLEYK